MNCKFCGGNEVRGLKKVSSPSLLCDYTLWECGACKCRFFDIAENKVDLSGFYEHRSEEYYAKEQDYSFTRNSYWERQVRRIEAVIGRKPSSVLDVGCRTGDFLMHFPAEAVREGVELSRKSVQVARDRGLLVHNDFVEKIEFGHQFEAVTCYALLEHLVEPLAVISKLTEIVSAGGVLVILIPTHECFKTWVIENLSEVRWHMYSPPEHLNLFSKLFLDRYISQFGFRLALRYWTSGGMMNPFKDVPTVGGLFSKFMTIVDEYSPLNRIPVFDHIYSYYVKS